MGDVIAELGTKNGWSGVVIFGAIRGARSQSLDFAFGVEALGSNPQKSTKLGGECVDIVASFGGVTFTPGQWLYGDDDGVLGLRHFQAHQPPVLY